MSQTQQSVVITDAPWSGVDVEREIFEAAGISLHFREEMDDAQWRVRVSEADAIMTCWANVDRAMMQQAAPLRCVARIGVGLDNIDLVAGDELGLVVTNVPDYCVDEVAEYVLAAVSGWARGLLSYRTGADDKEVRTGAHRMRNLTIGIWGLGRIGRRAASIFSAIGCQVLGHSNHAIELEGVEQVSREDLLDRADVVSLHVPGDTANRGLIGATQISRMCPGSLLVNTARGLVVDSAALLEGLASGHLGGAVLDVVDGDPDTIARLRSHPSCLVTPHIAFSSTQATDEVRRRASEDVVRVLAGEQPVDRVLPRD